MKKFANISGILGIALFLFGFVTFLFTETLSLYTVLHLVGGLLLLGWFVVSNARNLGKMVGGRAARTFGETTGTAVFVIAAVVGLNLIANLYPHQFDLTRDRLFSLSDQTVKILKALDTDVHGMVFQQGGVAPQAEDLLKLYSYQQKRFTYEVIDPDRRPELTEKYEIRQNGTLVLSVGDRTQKISELDEENLTNGLTSLLAGQQTTVGFLVDHEELGTDDQQNPGGLGVFKMLLEEENYRVETVSLIQTGSVPDDIDVLIVASPRQPLFGQEVSAISQFVQNGGRLLALGDPLRRGLDPLAAAFGVQMGNDMLIDQEVRLFAGPTLGTQIMVSEYGDHPVTRDFPSRVLLAQASSVAAPADSNYNWTDLLLSSYTSWAETDLTRLLEAQEADQGDADQNGPVVVGVAFSGVDDDAGAGAFIGDADFLSNRMIGQLGNADLGLNLVAWMAGETAHISIRPKQRGRSSMTLTQDQMISVFYGTVLIFPEFLLLAGLFVWWQRKQRR